MGSKKVPGKKSPESLFTCASAPVFMTSTKLLATWRKSCCWTCRKNTKSSPRSIDGNWRLWTTALYSWMECCKLKKLKLLLADGPQFSICQTYSSQTLSHPPQTTLWFNRFRTPRQTHRKGIWINSQCLSFQVRSATIFPRLRGRWARVHFHLCQAKSDW